MKFPSNLLDLLIDQDVCRVMPEAEFIRFCTDRAMKIDKRRLRQFERIGVFQPLLRAYRPEITLKIEIVDGGYRELGEIKEGEAWDGGTRVELVDFDPDTGTARSWRDHGLLWVPGEEEWEHRHDIDDDPLRHEAYYSRYQIYALDWVVGMMTMHVPLEGAVGPDGSAEPKWSPRMRHQAAEWGRRAAAGLRGPRDADTIAVLLQFVANRFFYKTRDDGRQITIGQFHDWEWGSYARSWSPTDAVNAVGITEDESRGWYERLDVAWTNADPIAGWWNLARFVRVAKRDRLKGDALRAVTLREMAHMMRLFHREAFGADLRPLGEVGRQIFKRVPDIDPDRDPMRALELVANDFGVSGKPQLVLFVEGPTELAVLPAIFERLWGAPASRYGIEFSNLGGVGNVAGGKENPFSAIWRLVDYLHHHQTLAFVLLDNEGFARNVVKGLPRAGSVHSTERKATRPDHVKVWRTNFELENFSDTEMARAMDAQAGRKAFAPSDVAACRHSMSAASPRGTTLMTIDRLYMERIGTALDKPALGLLLVEAMFDPKSRRSIGNRPITQFLVRVAKKAARNFQPVTEEDWRINQRSGYLGSLQPAAKRERRRHMDRRRRSRSK